jgi:hypothetical protein
MPASKRHAARLLAFACLMLSAATAPAAAQVMNRESALEMRKQFMTDLDTLQSKMLALATAIPEDKYGWRPAPGVRSIGEAFMHVASEYYVFTPMAYGAKRSPVIPPGQGAFENFEKASTKADALKHLKEGFAYMHDQLSSLDPSAISGTPKLFGKERTIAETSMIMTADLHEHLGQLIAYARMNGIKPPWSK